MDCARCSEKNLKRAYNVPSRKRGEFIEQVCKRCRDIDRYLASRPKKPSTAAFQAPEAGL